MLLYATVYGRSGWYVFDTGASPSYLDIDPKRLLPSRLGWSNGNGKRKLVWTRALLKISFGYMEMGARSEATPPPPPSATVDVKKYMGMTEFWKSACLKGTGARFHSQKAKSFCTGKNRIISSTIPL
ncbi:MAG: hypothetical protein LBF60_08870 [Treponema sp.]|nr:hypothetical protein [Treponema sp.]